MLKKIFTKLFDSTEKEIARLQLIVDSVGEHEAALKDLSADELRGKTSEFRERLKKGTTLDDLLPEAFAVVREAAMRTIGQRHYDQQVMGGIVLHRGMIAEMKTGEGKTLTSTLAIYLNALEGKGVHVVTVNDYLARRDTNWMGVIFEALDISTACIVHAHSYIYRGQVLDNNEVDIEYENLVEVSRTEAYVADITYGTNNEFGFDYLRDNMAQSAEAMVQRAPNYAIVDEVDSILIDESRTPLIISAPDSESTKRYAQFAAIVPILTEGKHFTIDEKVKTVALTDNGVDVIEEKLGVDNVYESANVHLVNHLEQAIKAQFIFIRDKDYVVKNNQILIVDDFTGRLMEGRRYSDGLHQAIEAKEGVTVQKESKTLATITFQNYFRLYEKLAGMTGTALTSAEEFAKVYELDIMAIPTNKPLIRDDRPDIVYKTEAAKLDAIAQEVAGLHAEGQPVLVGTIAIEKSEEMSKYLKKYNVPHEILNAKNHEREAQIVAAAGERGAVTIATNMAGRGTDIKLGEGVLELGGLCIIGTERHEARRIDNQLRGRAGRQGDAGMSQFFVSLEDELMRRFGGDKLKSMMTKLGLPDNEPIRNKIIARSIESAQTKIEGFNFDMRKHILEYDDVVNKQRETIYARRRSILFAKEDAKDLDEFVINFARDIAESHTVGEELHWQLRELADEVAKVVPGVDIFAQIDTIADDENMEKDTKRTKIVDIVSGNIDKLMSAQRVTMGEEAFGNISQAVMLQTIDNNWMKHLDALDYLRSGIGLRGYGQRDPLVEYKRESYLLFRDMMTNARTEIVQTILSLQIAQNNSGSTPVTPSRQLEFQGAQEPQSFAQIAKGAQESSGANSDGEETKQQPIQVAQTPGRNDICSCGSGRKYKKCCGK